MAAEQAGAQAGAATTTEAASLLDQVVAATKAKSTDEASRAKGYLKEFLDQAVKPRHVVSKDVEQNIKYWMKEVDKKPSVQLDAILHHPDYQRVEGTWRGLHYLVMQTETGESMQIRVLNVSKRELFKDLEKAVEFDQSVLFKKCYEEE